MNRFKVLAQLIRYFGLQWLIFRIKYALQLRSGYLRIKLPSYQWADRPLSYWLSSNIPNDPQLFVTWRREHAGNFFFEAFEDRLDTVKIHNKQALIASAEDILAGNWSYFTGDTLAVGMPPDWHLNPLTQQSIRDKRHWGQISDFAAGDIKFIWEASRFSVVFTLVRAFALTADVRYPQAFWQLIDDWAIQNPPQQGANWKCGQESSFRVMAWCFGLYAFQDFATPTQLSLLTVMIAAHGERIEGNLAYGRSQNNNHGISEGVGLWTIGILFPELKSAQHWAELGRQVIIEEMARQIYADGSYAQYSPNYQRVMLHTVIWAMRLGELNKARFPDELYQQVENCKNFLYAILDLDTGFVPNHGSNDSALILNLNQENPRDFRPLLQSTHYLVHGTQLFDTRYEDLFWLFAVVDSKNLVKDTPLPAKSLNAAIGGYYTLRSPESWAMIRCAKYIARPQHADQLHVDFWWKGINLLCDAGTYLYNAPAPWNNGLRTSKVHNTVTVDEHDQMHDYSRFLWLDWCEGLVHQHTENYWEGSHNGYKRIDAGINHRRGILRLDNVWLIVDELASSEAHDYTLHWLIPNLHYTLQNKHLILETQVGTYNIYLSHDMVLNSGNSEDVYGWHAPTYGRKDLAISLQTHDRGKKVIFWTLLSPKPIDLTWRDSHLFIDKTAIQLGGKVLIQP